MISYTPSSRRLLELAAGSRFRSALLLLWSYSIQELLLVVNIKSSESGPLNLWYILKVQQLPLSCYYLRSKYNVHTWSSKLMEDLSLGPLFLVSTLFTWTVHSGRFASCSLSCFSFPTHHPFLSFFPVSFGFEFKVDWVQFYPNCYFADLMWCSGTTRLSELGRAFFSCTCA